MVDDNELLMRIIDNENKHIDSMSKIIKEDELTILRLQNKTRIIAIEIEERKQLVEEYRNYLKHTPNDAVKRSQLNPLADPPTNTNSSVLKFVRAQSLSH